MYDAIIRSESATMNESVKHTMDIFQLKGLRKILKVKTTWVDRTQYKNKLFDTMQAHIHRETAIGKPEKYSNRTQKFTTREKVNY